MMTDNITVMLITLNRGIENNKNIWFTDHILEQNIFEKKVEVIFFIFI